MSEVPLYGFTQGTRHVRHYILLVAVTVIQG